MKLIEGVQPQEDVTHKLYEAGKFASGGKTVVCLGRKTEEDRSVKKICNWQNDLPPAMHPLQQSAEHCRYIPKTQYTKKFMQNFLRIVSIAAYGPLPEDKFDSTQEVYSCDHNHSLWGITRCQVPPAAQGFKLLQNSELLKLMLTI